MTFLASSALRTLISLRPETYFPLRGELESVRKESAFRVTTGVDDEDVRADNWCVREKEETIVEIRFPRRLVKVLDRDIVPWLEDEANRCLELVRSSC